MKKYFSTKLFIITLALQIAMPATVYSAEDDLYKFLWLDPDKSVYVLQNKIHPKKRTFYADIGYIYGLSNEFQDTKGISLEFGYFLNETWALELNGNLYNNSNNDAYNNLQIINGSVPFIRRLNKSYSLFAIWSPFYGKINTFNRIFYFDWSFGAGLTKIDAESNALTASNPTKSTNFSKESYMGLSLKTGVKFYINKRIHLNTEYNRTTYKAPGPTVKSIPGDEKFRVNSDFVVSIGFSF